ncbi:MAG: sigma-54 dependent transcriptional regulator [Bacteroidota bacterium]
MTAVLIVEDDAGLRGGLVSVVQSLGFQALAAAGIDDARAIVRDSDVDCVLLDIRLRDGDGLDYLRELRAGKHGDLPVIVATAYGDSERTIRAMRDGAFDYVTKPFDLPRLRALVERAVKHRGLSQALPISPPGGAARGDMVGTSLAMLGIWKLVGRAAASTAPVLITGETGTGKELVARAIHDYSARSQQPFIAVNVAALPPTLIESELFGHEKGAFTGATARRNGRFELAAGGTLFLDEIGDLDMSLQTKLLRVLQSGTFERVGGGEPLSNAARVVTATNKPVRPRRNDDATGGGGGDSGRGGSALREDLYYRLAVIEIDVPPLRARRSDIPLLVARALEGTSARAVSEDAMARLLAYSWPGNVRELFHGIERAAVLCGGEVIDVDDLSDSVRRTAVSAASGGDAADDLPLRDAVAQLERRLIARALERAGGNRSEAARQLGIGRPQLYAKLDEHGMAGRGGGDDPKT